MAYFLLLIRILMVVMLVGLAVTLIGGLVPYFLTFQYESSSGHAGLYYSCDADNTGPGSDQLAKLCDKWRGESYGWEVAAKTLIGLTFASQAISVVMAMKIIRKGLDKKFVFYSIPILSVVRVIFIVIGISLYAANYKNLADEFNVKVQLGVCYWLVTIGIVTNVIAAILGVFIICVKPNSEQQQTPITMRNY